MLIAIYIWKDGASRAAGSGGRGATARIPTKAMTREAVGAGPPETPAPERGRHRTPTCESLPPGLHSVKL